MEITYDNKLVKKNVFLTIYETQKEPKIKLNLDNNYFYTLIMYDPDAIGGTYIHWMIVNITRNDIKSGNIIIHYKGPSPPSKTGKHHYIFDLYKQDSHISNFFSINKRAFELNEFKKQFGLVKLIIKQQFISENINGGKKTLKQKFKIKKTKKNRKK